jgi:hypothetical protein
MLQTITDTQTDLATSCLVLHDISWETYEQLLEIFAERSTPRMTYYQGTLELMVPLPEHDSLARGRSQHLKLAFVANL